MINKKLISQTKELFTIDAYTKYSPDDLIEKIKEIKRSCMEDGAVENSILLSYTTDDYTVYWTLDYSRLETDEEYARRIKLQQARKERKKKDKIKQEKQKQLKEEQEYKQFLKLKEKFDKTSRY